MRNSRLDRILYIQQVLVQGGVLNKQQTADRFGVSEKTIQRDLDTLRSYFADSEPRREILYNSAKGGYLLDDTLSRFLTSSEILAVCKILLESRSMVKEEMFPILDKLVQVCTPLDRLNQVKSLISNERFHYVEPQHGRKFIESLWDIGTAVENHNVMEITYCRTHDGETRVRTIEPVGILFSEYYFYLAAFIEGIDKDMVRACEKAVASPMVDLIRTVKMVEKRIKKNGNVDDGILDIPNIRVRDGVLSKRKLLTVGELLIKMS